MVLQTVETQPISTAARGAGRRRAESETLKEVLQGAIYCGVPTANAAFHLLGKVMADLPGGTE